MNFSNIGRIIFGFGYIAAAIFNFIYTRQNIQLLWDWFLESGQIMFIKGALQKYIIPNSTLIITLVIILEFLTGLLILAKGIFAKLGLVLGILWTLGLIPFFPVGPATAVNIILLLIQLSLMRSDYEKTFIELLFSIF